jgi:hypothetical protein
LFLYKIGPGSHVEYPTGTKNSNFVEEQGTFLLSLVPIGPVDKVSVFYADRKSKMATTAGLRLTLDPMGKCSNAFFSETTNMIKAISIIQVVSEKKHFETFSHRVQC